MTYTLFSNRKAAGATLLIVAVALALLAPGVQADIKMKNLPGPVF
jgi:hypothetical protein